jgi:hypothetical protein
MPTRSKAKKTTRRSPTTSTSASRRARRRTTKTGALPAVTVAARQISETVSAKVRSVRRDPAKLKNIGKAAAVAAGLFTTGLLLRRRKG